MALQDFNIHSNWIEQETEWKWYEKYNSEFFVYKCFL